MGNELIMAAVPSESVGGYVWLRAKNRAERKAAREARQRDEYQPFSLRMSESLWRPPEEPWREHGLDWHKDPKVRRAHLKAVRESLEAFLNGHLAQLDGMLRTGWFILGKVRMRIVECRDIGERGVEGRPRKPRKRAKKKVAARPGAKRRRK